MRYALFIFYISISGLNAQPMLQWQISLGGTNTDQANCIKVTNDGGYIVTGSTLSNDGDVFGNHGGADFWVLKINAIGSVQWKKSFGGIDHDRPNSLVEADDGGFLVVGSTLSTDTNVFNNHGYYDIWAIKLTSQGDLEWQNCYGGSEWDEATSVIVKDGGFVLAGQTRSNDGDITNNHGGFDFWVLKVDSVGKIIWQRTFGGSLNEKAYALASTQDGGYVVVGEASSTDHDVHGNHGQQPDCWVVKLNFDGKIEWEKSLGGTGIDDGRDVVQNADGDLFVLGQASSNNGDITNPHGGFDFWLIKLSGSGISEWQKSYGGSSPDNAFAMCLSPDKSLMLTGVTQSTDGDVSLNDGGADIWVLNISETGNIIWNKTLGGKQAEVGNSIQVTPDNGLIIAGYSLSNDGDVTLNHGKPDFWVVKLSPTNTPTLTPTLTQLTLYPNPTNQQLTLQTPDNEPITYIQITDLSGKTLKTEQAPQDKTLQVAMLPKGMYLLKATSDYGKVFCGKFIKE